MNSGCKLVVVEGAHSGAEIALADGTYLVGADLSCDLVLLDPGIAKKHLRLRVDGGRVSIERLVGSQVMLHGVVVEETAFTVMDKDEIGLGGAVFRLTGVVLTEPKPKPEPEVEIFDGPPTLEIVDEAQSQARPQHASESGSAAEPQAALPQTPVPPPRQRHHPVVWGLPLVVVLVGMGTFFGSRALQASSPLRAQHQQAKLAAAAPQPRDELVARVREFLGDDGLNVQRDPQGRIVVSGKTRAVVVKQQLADIKNDFKETIEIVDRVAYVSDNKPHNTVRLPQRITDIHVGEVRWFQTADGMRNFEGSVLEDGAEVVRISIEGIAFRKDGKLAIFKLNEEERTK